MTSSEELLAALETSAAKARDRDLTIGDLLDALGDASYGFVCTVFAVPFVFPFSLGPFTIAGGLALAGLGVQLAAGRRAPWLPRRVREVVLPPKVWAGLITACRKFFTFCRRFTRPRGQAWVQGRRGQAVVGSLILAAGLLMAIPMLGVPLNNALPALAILFACVGELEQDGAMLLVSVFWLVVTVAYFALVAWLVFVAGVNVTDWLRH